MNRAHGVGSPSVASVFASDEDQTQLDPVVVTAQWRTEDLQSVPAAQSTSWTRPTWRVALDHQFTPDIMGYISDDRGFKSGVYNLLTYAAPLVNPEVLDAYQLGMKTELAKHRVRHIGEAITVTLTLSVLARIG